MDMQYPYCDSSDMFAGALSCYIESITCPLMPQIDVELLLKASIYTYLVGILYAITVKLNDVTTFLRARAFTHTNIIHARIHTHTYAHT